MKRHRGAEQGHAPGGPAPHRRPTHYIVELEELTRHAFELIDKGNTYGPNFERPTRRSAKPFDEDMEAQLAEYYQRQARIILEIVSRTNKTQEVVVQKMLASVYASSLEDFSKAYGFDARPDFGELLLYYVHHGGNDAPDSMVDAVHALVSSAYDKYGLMILDDPRSIYRKPVVRAALTGPRLRLLMRVAGRHAGLTMLRLLMRMTDDVVLAQEASWTMSDDEEFAFEQRADLALASALEMGRLDIAEALSRWFPVNKQEFHEAGLKGIVHHPEMVPALRLAGFVPKDLKKAMEDNGLLVPLDALTTCLHAWPERNHQALLFASWYYDDAPLREKIGVLKQDWNAWIEVARQKVKTGSELTWFLSRVPLDPECLPDLLAFTDSVFGQKDAAATLDRDDWIKWAVQSGCIHALAAHRFVVTWGDVESQSRYGNMYPLDMRYFKSKAFSLGLLLKEAQWYDANGPSLVQTHDMTNTSARKIIYRAICNVIEDAALSRCPTHDEYVELLDWWGDDLSPFTAFHLCRILRPDFEDSSHLLGSLNKAASDGALWYYTDEKYNDNRHVTRHDVLEAWSGLFLALVGGDQAYFSRLDNVVEGELQTFAEHIRRQVPQSLIQTILGEHIVDDFTYRYPRSLFLFLYSLDLEGMVGNAVDAPFVYNMHVLRECAYDAEQQLFVNYGPRERAALLFFEALLAWEVGGRREKIKFML